MEVRAEARAGQDRPCPASESQRPESARCGSLADFAFISFAQPNRSETEPGGLRMMAPEPTPPRASRERSEEKPPSLAAFGWMLLPLRIRILFDQTSQRNVLAPGEGGRTAAIDVLFGESRTWVPNSAPHKWFFSVSTLRRDCDSSRGPLECVTR